MSPLPRAPQQIVVLDDDAALRQALIFSLEIEGYAVQAFETGADLLAMAEGLEPACLVFDYHLGPLNGLDVLAGLRARGFSAPAILITSNPRPEVRDRAGRLGAAIVEKPLLGDLLIARIRELAPA